MNRRREIKIWAIVLWLAIWEIAALAVNQEIFLVSPHRAVLCFLELALDKDFWLAVMGSTLRILIGFILAALLGVLLAGLASRFGRLKEFLAPMTLAVKTVPVASFVILALICFSSKYLSVLISFLIAFPLIYQNTLSGIEGVDEKLLEMGRVFRLSRSRVMRYIHAPEVVKFLRPAMATAIGMAWKAGIAAEVIGIPKGSMGAKIQQAKVYLETPDLIAWTLGVIILSALSEKLILFILDRADRGLKRTPKAVPEGPGKGPARDNILLSGVGKTFGEEVVLKDFNGEIEGGKLTTVMGESGVGKTTLLRIIAGLENADEGRVEGAEGKRLAFVFQEDRLLEYMDALGNIRIASHLSEDEIGKAMRAVKMEDTQIHGKPVSELSGGQKRRIALVRALMTESDVILMDEPFKGLDQDTRSAVMNFVKERIAGKTAVLVTHDAEEAELLGGNNIITFANSSYYVHNV